MPSRVDEGTRGVGRRERGRVAVITGAAHHHPHPRGSRRLNLSAAGASDTSPVSCPHAGPELATASAMRTPVAIAADPVTTDAGVVYQSHLCPPFRSGEADLHACFRYERYSRRWRREASSAHCFHARSGYRPRVRGPPITPSPVYSAADPESETLVLAPWEAHCPIPVVPS